MKILFRGGNFVNKGDEAMLRTVVRELGKRIEDIEFWHRIHFGQAEHSYAAGINPVFRSGGVVRSGLALLKGICRRLDLARVAAGSPRVVFDLALTPVPDAIIDISGFAYCDLWGTRVAKGGHVLAAYARSIQRPYVCLPHAWGPFTDPEVARHVTELCSFALVVYARDCVSLRHLAALLGDGAKKVKLAPDIAFRFAGAGPEAGAALLRKVGIEPGKRPLIGITPDMRVYERAPGIGRANVYIRFLANAARFCQRVLDAAVLLIPHEIQLGNGTVRDDRFLCRLLHDTIAESGITAKVVDNLTSDFIHSLYHHLDLVTGSRFHSLVFALSSQVPVVAIGWDHKYKELLAQFGLEEFALDWTNLDQTALQAVLTRARDNRLSTRNMLASRVRMVQRQVDDMFDEVTELLTQVGRGWPEARCVGFAFLNAPDREPISWSWSAPAIPKGQPVRLF